jgi:hypothetical protein
MSDQTSQPMVRFGLGMLLYIALCSAPYAQGVTGYQQGQGGSPVQGAAGTNSSTGNDGLEHCPKPMGAIAVVEPQDQMLQSLSRYSLSSPTSLIRWAAASSWWSSARRRTAISRCRAARPAAG